MVTYKALLLIQTMYKKGDDFHPYTIHLHKENKDIRPLKKKKKDQFCCLFNFSSRAVVSLMDQALTTSIHNKLAFCKAQPVT